MVDSNCVEPPATGELAELVAWLRMYGATGRKVLDQTPWTASQLDRAASLLERLSPPQPVSVAERLPGPGDCDSLGRCWWWYPETAGTLGYWQWEADAMEREADSQPVAWLPFYALPVPTSGEGEQSA